MFGNKRGDKKYDVMISLILGLVVIGLVLYFVFFEYFSEDDINWETCRQSIVLRSGAINNAAKKVQENFPFKCKTEVVEIDFKDYEKAGKLIMDTMAQCWYLYGEGKNVLYAEGFLGSEKRCFYCARIHFSKDVKEFYSPALDNIEEQVKNIPEVKAKQEEILELIKKKDALKSSADWKKSDEFYKLLEQELKLEEEYRFLLSEHLDELENYRFHWMSYLAEKMKGSDKTYGQYIYNFKDSKAILGKKPFGDSFAENIEYSDFFDANKGDLLIPLIYKKAAFNFYFWREGQYMLMMPHQTNQNLCEGKEIETIPA